MIWSVMWTEIISHIQLKSAGKQAEKERWCLYNVLVSHENGSEGRLCNRNIA